MFHDVLCFSQSSRTNVLEITDIYKEEHFMPYHTNKKLFHN